MVPLVLTSVHEQVRVARAFVPKLCLVTMSAIIGLPLLPFVWIGSRIYHRPPNMVYASHLLRYLHCTWITANPPAPGFVPLARLWLTLAIIQHGCLSPVWAAAWLLDEIIYGSSLDDEQIQHPFFLVSAGRSGSTRFTRYLEEDPELLPVSFLCCLFPYLWLWKLVPWTIGRFLNPDLFRSWLYQQVPPEFHERHELDPFLADTFDPAFMSPHLMNLSLNFGPEISLIGLNFAEYALENQHLFEHDFPDLVDRLGRKALLLHRYQQEHQCQLLDSNRESASTSISPRFYIKGHFLNAAPALARRFPDATFLTITRDPLSRLQSQINFLRSAPADPFLGPIPWEWLVVHFTEMESRYCGIEQEWFTSPSPSDDHKKSRHVVRFQDFVNDLPGTMSKVYKECLGRDAVPDHVPRVHPPRERKKYTVNRSLEELGVDEEALKGRLSDYIAWISQSPE